MLRQPVRASKADKSCESGEAFSIPESRCCIDVDCFDLRLSRLRISYMILLLYGPKGSFDCTRMPDAPLNRTLSLSTRLVSAERVIVMNPSIIHFGEGNSHEPLISHPREGVSHESLIIHFRDGVNHESLPRSLQTFSCTTFAVEVLTQPQLEIATYFCKNEIAPGGTCARHLRSSFNFRPQINTFDV